MIGAHGYTHTGEAAAIDAVSGLPFVLGEAPKALPAPAAANGMADGATVPTPAVLALADKLTAETWATVRDELRALACGVQPCNTAVLASARHRDGENRRPAMTATPSP